MKNLKLKLVNILQKIPSKMIYFHDPSNLEAFNGITSERKTCQKHFENHRRLIWGEKHLNSEEALELAFPLGFTTRNENTRGLPAGRIDSKRYSVKFHQLIKIHHRIPSKTLTKV